MALLEAASIGEAEKCIELIRSGVPWNTVIDGKTCGQVALENGHIDLYNQLVEEGVRTEYVLKMLGHGFKDDREETYEKPKVVNQEYLQSSLVFKEGKLLDEHKNGVMMGWETPLMAIHTRIIAPTEGLRILNVGFGLGIIDEMIQATNPSQHTIIEAHPDVYQKMLQDGWDKKPNVKILYGRWQDVQDQLELYDGIFFDTFGEYYDDLKEFHDIVPNILDQDGIYSYFNGLAGNNRFFHDVGCRMSEIDLNECMMTVEYETVQMDTLGDDVWEDVRRPYFSLDFYRAPIVRFQS
ncbi:S-adenosyl-L-methionine-dependent methyltransferase [Gorgonomyces haynaldii]|nr:S-adenosyl-L-methionine-dependent methyltransferase [Gorgonomyces haynaldii]